MIRYALRYCLLAWVSLSVLRVSAQAPPAELACARRDTLLLGELASGAQLREWTALRTAMRGLERRTCTTEAELQRWFEAAERLGLRAERVRAADRLSDFYTRAAPECADAQTYLDIMVADLDAVPPAERSQINNAIGNGRLNLGDFATALWYYQSAYETAHRDSVRGRAYALGNMAIVYTVTGDTASAALALHESIALTEALPEPERGYNNVYDYSTLADLYFGSNRADSASLYFGKCAAAFARYPVGDPRSRELAPIALRARVHETILDGDYARAHGRIDSLEAANPRSAVLLRAAVLRREGRAEEAYEVLAKAGLREGYDYEATLRAMIDLAKATGRPREHVAYLETFTALQATKLRGAYATLGDLSTAQRRSFDRERAATARRHTDELALVRSRQQVWMSVTLVPFLLAFALWALYRYRRSHERSRDLRSIVTQRDEDLSRANAALEQKVRDLEEFNHLLSHDLREPLRSISGFTSLLGRRLGADPELAEDVGFLRGAIDQLNFLHEGVERLRRTKERRLAVRGVDLVAMTEGLVASFRAEAPAALVGLRVAPLPKAVSTDPVIYQTIVWELLSNAAKFSPAAEPRVYVELYAHEGTVVVAVEDEGIGIPAAYHAQVFEVFKRLNRREDFPGAGIGLAVAKTAAARIGADLTLARSVVGVGSRFTLALPREVGPAGTKDVPEKGFAAEATVT